MNLLCVGRRLSQQLSIVAPPVQILSSSFSTLIHSISRRSTESSLARSNTINWNQINVYSTGNQEAAMNKMEQVKCGFVYPQVRRDDSVVDDYHGTKVYDPYRWLEDPDSEETKQFVEEQNKVTDPYIKACPHRDSIKTRLTELWNFAKYSCPYKRGNRYFFYKNSGLQNHSVFYVQDSLTGEPRVFLDPNTLSEDGTVAMSASAFSKDGELFAYSLAKSGSDWVTIHFKTVATGEDLPEVIDKVKFSSIEWTHDNKGIFYNRYPEQEGKTDGSETTSNENQKLFYHKIGTKPSEDVLVVDFPEHPKWMIGAGVSDCGQYLIVYPAKECRDNQIYFAKITEQLKSGFTEKLKLTPVVTKFEADYEYVTNNGPKFFFRTNKDAPNYRLLEIDFDEYENGVDVGPKDWRTVIPEHEKDVLDWLACVDKDKLVACYMHDVKSILELRNLEDGKFLYNFPLDVGAICGYSGKREHSEMFFLFKSYLTPGKIFHVDFTKPVLEATMFREVAVNGFDPSSFQVSQVFYKSKDGTEIPMFLIHRKDLKMDGRNPCLLYGYGGFNQSMQPSFSLSTIIFMQLFDGVMAVANIRGGGEYGEQWHNAGRLLQKQNSYDDFQAAAEYLIETKYTSSTKLVIQGGSNGGLTVGACVNQRPDLFGAAIAEVGVMDLLRFHKFTIGYAWTSDYGSPDEKVHFENVLKFSPLHNVRVPDLDSNAGDTNKSLLPAILLITADHDDRVVPLHSFKLIAELQHKLGQHPQQTSPLMIRIDTKAGHGAGKPTAKVIEQLTDVLCFCVQSLDLKVIL